MNWNDIYFELRCALPREAAKIITRELIHACKYVISINDINLCSRIGMTPITSIGFQFWCPPMSYVSATPARCEHIGFYKDTDSIFTTQKMAAAFLPYMLQKYTARDLTGSAEISPEMLGTLPLRGRSSFDETSARILPEQTPRKLRAADLGQPTRRQKIKARRARG